MTPREGVRFGEMAALRVSRLDLSRRRAMIAESVTVVQGRGLVWGTPKTHERRHVPIPKFLVAELHVHIEGKRPDELVFTGVRGGGPLRASIFGTGFDVAAQAIGVSGLHPHELRHTAASLAKVRGIASDASFDTFGDRDAIRGLGIRLPLSVACFLEGHAV